MQVGGHTTKEFSKKVRFSAFAGYGFQDKLWKWGGATEFMLGDNQKRTHKLTISASKDYESLGRGSGAFTEKNIVNSLLAPGGFDKQGMVLKAQVMHEYEFNPSFNSTLTLQHLRIYANPDIPLIRPDGTEAGSREFLREPDPLDRPFLLGRAHQPGGLRQGLYLHPLSHHLRGPAGRRQGHHVG